MSSNSLIANQSIISSEVINKKSHKRNLLPHFKGLVKSIRGDKNELECGLCDLIDNVDGIVCKNKLSNIGCWIEILYDENNKIHQITITDNLHDGFNGLDNEGTDHPLNMTHIREGHGNDNESSEFGTGMKKALIYIGNSCEIYTRSIENGTDTCWYIKMDFVEMSQRVNADDSYELTIIEKISYEKYRQYHNKDFGSTIIISNIRHDSICSYTDKQVFEKKIKDYLSEKFTERFRVGAFSLYLNNELIRAQPDVFHNNDNKFTWKFYIPIVNNSIKGENIVVYKIKHGGLNKKLKFGMVTIKDKKGNKTEQFGFVEDKSLNFDIYINSRDYHELTFESCSTSKTEFSDIKGENEVDIARMRSHGKICFVKKAVDGYSNYISNRVKYNSKKLNQFLGVSSFKQVSLKENILTSALRCAQTETTKHFVAQRRKECKENNANSSNSNSDDDSSVVSSISFTTNSSVGSKRKPAVAAKKVIKDLIIPQIPNNNNNNNNEENVVNTKFGGVSGLDDTKNEVNIVAVIIEKPELSDNNISEVKVEIDNQFNNNNNNNTDLSGFGMSVPVSATQRINLSVKDGLEIINQLFEKEDLNINSDGLDNVLKMYLENANNKIKLKLLMQLVNEKYSVEDSNKHMLGGAELVRLSIPF